ncbi:hypothetical protein TWF718_009490 [Orbilia javanica]|uniref:Uncharacterized protein n=1 Tax=Orbilia javanica TaxID=47235 RepID=A0AAN8RFB0_9PEZI
MATDQDSSNYPVIKNMDRPSLDTTTVNRYRAEVLRTIARCRNCICTDDGGMALNPEFSRMPARPGRGIGCNRWYLVHKCIQWYDCYCAARMHQPDIEPGVSLQDYQNALNGIPDAVKDMHPNYEWNLIERFSMTWRQPRIKEEGNDRNMAFKHIDDRQLVPGTKEPYYLEGPGERDPMDVIFNPLMGGPGLSSRGFRRLRRNNIDGDEE